MTKKKPSTFTKSSLLSCEKDQRVGISSLDSQNTINNTLNIY